MKKNLTILYPLYLVAAFLFTGTYAHAHFTTKGPYGGSVKCMATSDSLIYVGTAEGGVFRTTNAAGTSWRYANYTGLTNASIKGLACIGKYVVAGTAGGGVFKSEDAGNTWAVSNNGLTNTNVLAMIAAGDHVIAGTNGGGIYLSHDSGSIWEQSNVGLTNLFVTCFAFDGTIIYAGTNNGVFMSLDEGDSWSPMSATGLSDMAVKAITISGNTLFAGTASGIFATPTSAISWVLSNTGLDNTTINGLTTGGGTVYALTNGGVYTSPDNSVSWTAANTGYSQAVNTLVIYNSKLYSGTQDGGVYRSNSVSTINWAEFNTGLNNLKTYAIHNSNQLVIAATNKGLFVSRDLAANYVRANNGLTDSLHITSIAFAGSKLYVATQNGGVFVSNDTGTTWTTSNAGLTLLNIQKIIASDIRIFAAASNGEVYSSLLSSINWSLNTGLPSGITPTSFATDGPTHVFLGTSTHGVFMCMDGSSWEASNTGLTSMNVTSLAISGGSTLFAGTNGAGVFKRPLMGSWTAVGTGLPSNTIYSLCASGQWVAAGYTGGIHVTYDNGSSWQAPNVMMYIPSYANITDISFSPSSTRIFVATPNNSLYSNGIAELPTGIREVTDNIGFLHISPNPGNGNFTLDLSNVKAAVKEITVYDQLGKLVNSSTLNDKNMQSMDFALSLSSGIYFIKVNTELGAIVQKIVIE
jgi:hypothetical protein